MSNVILFFYFCSSYMDLVDNEQCGFFVKEILIERKKQSTNKGGYDISFKTLNLDKKSEIQ